MLNLSEFINKNKSNILMLVATVLSTVIFIGFNKIQTNKIVHLEKYIYEDKVTFLKKDATAIKIKQDIELLKSSQGGVR